MRGRTAAAPSTDTLLQAVTDALGARDDVKVDAKVLQRAQEMQGTLLDVLA